MNEFARGFRELWRRREQERLFKEHAKQSSLDRTLRMVVSDTDLLACVAEHGRDGQARSTMHAGKKELPLFEQEVYVTHTQSKRIPTVSINQDGRVQIHRWRGGEVAIQAQLLPIDETTSTAILEDGSRLPIVEGEIERYRHLIDQGTAFVVTDGDFVVQKGTMLGEIYNILSALHGITPVGLHARAADIKSQILTGEESTTIL